MIFVLLVSEWHRLTARCRLDSGDNATLHAISSCFGTYKAKRLRKVGTLERYVTWDESWEEDLVTQALFFSCLLVEDF
jgi:hypothetical protein